MRNERLSFAIVVTGTVLLFAALLLLPGCRNVLQPQEPPSPNAEMGTLSLTVNGQERVRTILPQVPTFARYRLLFAQDDTDKSFTAIYPDGFPNPYVTGSPSSGIEILLPVGTTWSLNVFAYIQADDSEYSAHGLLASISVDSETISGNVELGPIEVGYGTFAWDIAGIPDDVIGISIIVYGLFDNIRAFAVETAIIDGRITGSTTPASLAAGQYRVLLTARYEDGETTVSEILHVFRNMTSTWNWVFIPRGDALLDFILNLWDADTDTWDFFNAGITHEHFGNYGLGIGGVREHNFWGLVQWFNELTENDDGNVPDNLIGLKALVDAALIGIDSASIAAGNHSDEATAEAAIRALAANVPDTWELDDWIRIYWVGLSADVLVGGVYRVAVDNAVRLQVTITFDGNAANVTGVPDPFTEFFGEPAWVPANQPERVDYFFAGWNTSPNATGSPYWPWDFIELGTEDITLYAIWSEFEFDLYGADGTVVITGLAEGRTDTDIVIPPVINGVLVTGIGWEAFMGGHWGDGGFVEGHQLTSVIIPDSITSIDVAAFWGNQLTSITIPDSVTSINVGVFANNQLTNIIIPDSVTYIGTNAFVGNQLTNVTINDGVTSIGNAAFQSNQLTNITIPDSVTRIGELAFESNQLTTVVIPDGITSLGSWAFSNNQLTSVVIPGSVTSIGSWAFSNNQLTSVIIPSGATSIGGWAFVDNRLTSVVIPDSVTSIGPSAFSSNLLTYVVIPDGVTSIESGAFSWNLLTSVIIPGDVIIAPPAELDPDAHTMGVHGQEFLRDYIANDRQADTYTWSPTQLRWVVGDGDAAFTISFAGFQTMPQDTTVNGPNVRIVDASTSFSVEAPPGYVFDNIRWFFDGQVRSTGTWFEFTRDMHGMRLGTHLVTLIAEIDGLLFSKIVNVTVVP